MDPEEQTTDLVRRNVRELTSLVASGRTAEALARFYAPGAEILDAWQQEYKDPVPGQEDRYIAGDVEVHEAQAVNVLVDGDMAAIQWRFVVSARRGVRQGELIPIRQVSMQRWDGGRIVREENYVG